MTSSRQILSARSIPHLCDGGKTQTVARQPKVFVRMLAQKLIFIHNAEKVQEDPRWRTNIDWVVKVREFNSISEMQFPDTTITNWKAGGTHDICWEKRINSARNLWLCRYLGIDHNGTTWRFSDMKDFSEFYTAFRSQGLSEHLE